MRFVRIIMIIITTFLTTVEIAQSTVIQTAYYNGHTYHLLDIDDWHNSEAEAVSLGGHLVTINDALEDNFIFNTFGPTVSSLSGNSIWLGLNDMEEEGNWEWVSGELVQYLNWAPGQPSSNPTEDMAGMFIGWSTPGQWHDILDPAASWDFCYGVVELTTSLFLSVTPDPLVPGETATFTLTFSSPNTKSYLAYSLNGTSPGSFYVPQLDVFLDLIQPLQAGNAKVTNSSGVAEWWIPIPSYAVGWPVWFQAAQYGVTSNSLLTTTK